jgi:hypothetical protein
MKKVPKSTTSAQPARRKAQQARPKIAAPATDGYVRLELRAEEGRLSILGLHEVAGPLAIPDAVIHGYVYEVLAGDRRVSLGSIPDVGGRRAFANADVSEPQRKHRFFPDAAFNFFVRIPKAELRPEMLAQMQIVLHRIDAAPDHVSEQPLAKHAGVENVEIARLQGIKIEELPHPETNRAEQINAFRRECAVSSLALWQCWIASVACARPLILRDAAERPLLKDEVNSIIDGCPRPRAAGLRRHGCFTFGLWCPC